MESKNKVALVTGAGSGVGKSAVIHLLKDGYSVALAGRRKELLNETIEESGVSNDKAIAVSLNKVPDIPLIKIKGKKTAIRINVVAIIANVICLEPLYAATNGVSPFSILV